MVFVEDGGGEGSAAVVVDEVLEFFGCCEGVVFRGWGECFDDEDAAFRCWGEFGSVCFAPVPSAADGGDVVFVDDFSVVGWSGFFVAEEEDGWFVGSCVGEVDVSVGFVEVFAAGGEEVFEADEVVNVNEGVDASEGVSVGGGSEEVFDGGAVFFGFGAEGGVGVSPGCDAGVGGDRVGGEGGFEGVLCGAECVEDGLWCGGGVGDV